MLSTTAGETGSAINVYPESGLRTTSGPPPLGYGSVKTHHHDLLHSGEDRLAARTSPLLKK